MVPVKALLLLVSDAETAGVVPIQTQKGRRDASRRLVKTHTAPNTAPFYTCVQPCAAGRSLAALLG